MEEVHRALEKFLVRVSFFRVENNQKRDELLDSDY